MRQATGTALPGIALGLVAVYWAVGSLQPFVYETDPRSPVLLGSVAVTVLAVILLATVPPARRAMRAATRLSM